MIRELKKEIDLCQNDIGNLKKIIKDKDEDLVELQTKFK